MMTASGISRPELVLVNQHLRHATLGLSKVEKEEVWSELEEHILTRAEQLQVLGLTSEQAYQQVLQELGSPLMVSVQLNKVHNMPKLIMLCLSLIFICGLGIYFWSKRPVDQVIQIRHDIQAKCLGDGKKVLRGYSEYRDCKSEVILKDQTFISTRVIEPILRYRHLKMGRQNQKYGTIQVDNLFGFSEGLMTFYSKEGKQLIDVEDLVTFNTGDVKLTGFPVPSIVSSAGKISFDAQTSTHTGVGHNLYGRFAQHAFTKLWNVGFKRNLYHLEGKGHLNVLVNTSYQDGDILALFVLLKKKKFPRQSDQDLISQHYIGQAIDSGVVQFKLPFQKLQFVSQAKDLKSVEETAIPTALLVKISDIPLNQIKTGIFVPESELLTLAD